MHNYLPPAAERTGSDGSAAGGGYSDLSEWPRSADDAAAPSARKLPGTATGILRDPQNDSIQTAQEILQKLAAWVKAQEADKLSVQNLKHATGVLKDLREILKSDMPDKPVEIIVQIGDEEYAQ